MYPDILNNYGDRGNVYALNRVAQTLDMTIDLKRINDFEEPVDYNWADIILFGAGELRTCQKMADTLSANETFKEAFEKGTFIFAFNMTGSVFAQETHRLDGSIIKGMGLLPMEGYEKEGVYGDDALVSIDGMDILGTQIQLVNYKLKEEGSQLGNMIYGYGNDYLSKKEGCRKNNLIFTNIQGPMFVNNPWYVEKILCQIAGIQVSNEPFDVEKYKDRYPLEVVSYTKIINHIHSKTKPTKEQMDFYMK